MSNSEYKEITAQKAVLRQGDEYLILLRANTEKAFPGLWDFPGGKLEQGEDPYKSVEREVFEETGLRIKAITVQATFESSLGSVPVHFVLYAAHIETGDLAHIIIGEEHAACKLATAAEILRLPNIMPYMEAYLTGQKTFSHS